MTPSTNNGAGKIEARLESWAILFLAATGVVAVLLMAFFTEREYGIEERTLYNIPYNFLHYGEMAFPAYGYWYHAAYHRLFVHSPTHYFVIGLLMKAGLTLYYAEALPAAAFAILCIVLICRAGFSRPVTFGLLAGFMSGLGWVATAGKGDTAFHLRPDLHMALAWLAGILMFESARLNQWDVKRVFAGALLLAYASTIHYSGMAAGAGILVYLLTAWRDLNYRDSRRILASAMLGACVIAAPYIVWQIIPNWHDIGAMANATSAQGSLAFTIKSNFPMYRGMASHMDQWPFPDLGYAAPLRVCYAYAIPPFIVATAVLLLSKPTRAMAIAGLPVPLFLFFYFRRKLASYLYPEELLCLMGCWLLVILAVVKLSQLTLPRAVRWAVWPGLSLLCCTVFATTTPVLREVKIKAEPYLHRLTVSRVVSKEVVGPHALVTSIHPLWSISGASEWFDLTQNLLWELPSENLDAYFSKFDAVAVPHRSGQGTQTGVTEGSLYESGILHLQGFLDSGSYAVDRTVWLTKKSNRPVTGFYRQDRTLKKFQESPNGSQVVVSLVITSPDDRLPKIAQSLAPLGYWALDLPRKPQSSVERVVLVLLLEAKAFEAMKSTPLANGAPLEVIRGESTTPDISALLANFHQREDRITFVQSYPELISRFVKEPAPRIGAETAHEIPLKWESFSQSVTLQPIGGAPASFEVGAKSVGSDWLITSYLPALDTDAAYLVSLDLKLAKGAVGMHVMREGVAKPMVTIYRDNPQNFTAERFVFHAGSGSPKTYLVVSGFNWFGHADVLFTLRNATLRKVELTR